MLIQRPRYFLYMADSVMILVLNLLVSRSWIGCAVLPVVAFLGLYAFRCYDHETLSSYSASLLRCITGSIIGYFIPSFLSLLMPGLLSPTQLLANYVFVVIVVPVFHKAWFNIYRKMLPERHYLLVGFEEGLDPLIDEIRSASIGKVILHPWHDDPPDPTSTDYSGLVFTNDEARERHSRQAEMYRKAGKELGFFPSWCERYLKRIPLKVLAMNKAYYATVFEESDPIPATRIVDIASGILLSVVFLPFMLVMGFAILLEDGRPVWIAQERVGLHGIPFMLRKFRSLKVADRTTANPNDGIEERVLAIGKVIRKIRLDETFQFLNVIAGTMSLVGPRPEMPFFHEQSMASVPYYSYRLLVKPGITGWAQVQFRHTSSAEDYRTKTEFDLYYIKYRSLFLDVRIMVMTLETMLGMRGSR